MTDFLFVTKIVLLGELMKKENALIRLYKNLDEKYPTLFEIFRFLIIGGIATIIDMLVMGVVLYIFDPSLYPHFYNVWVGRIGEPKTIATVVGTGTGFVVSLIFNYLLSVIFVYHDKGNSKTLKGKILFVILSTIGLLINMAGMWLGRDLLYINEWIVKIVMTLIVLVYNYITRKLIIFKTKSPSVSEADAESNTTNENEEQV